MEILLKTLGEANFFGVILYGIVVNVAIYCCSLILYALLTRKKSSQQLGESQPITKADISLSLITVICNTIVFVSGVVLWKNGFIKLAENPGGLRIASEVLFMTLIMDLLMYIFHRSVHVLRYFSSLHNRHHEHESTNMLSLFVLHPVESIGFGLMMLAVVCIFPLSAIGISLYLLLNSVWGTLGHLHNTVLPVSWLRIAKRSYVCTSEFHYLHHREPGYNFGFYFSFWDALFDTLHPELKSAKEISG